MELLRLSGITKSFGDNIANDHIDLTLERGEVHALLGENGAGKSTLMNIIYGIYRPDSGKIFVRGKEVKIASSRQAMDLGIGMVHQHFMLVDRMNAVENVCLIDKSHGFAKLDRKKVRASLEALKEQYGIEVDLDAPVSQLSISMQQKIEILKLLYTGADILILDEPTAVLLPQETEALFAIIRNMTAQEKGVIFISHKLDEVLQISRRVSVLTHGKVTGEVLTDEADKSRIVRMMSGDSIPYLSGSRREGRGEEVLSCRSLEAFDDRGVKTLSGVDLTLYAGEIIGIAGVEGNGQNELAEVLAGVRPAASGTVILRGEDLSHASGKAFIKGGIGYIPADRSMVGSVESLSLADNWPLRKVRVPRKGGLLDGRTIQAETAAAMEAFDVRATGPSQRSAELSGGNLQKFILARELSGEPKVLIASYPTRGLDVRASWFIRNRLIAARDGGAGVLLFSGDMEELFTVADRIAVLYRGQVIGEVEPRKSRPEDVIRLMMGEKGQEPYVEPASEKVRPAGLPGISVAFGKEASDE